MERGSTGATVKVTRIKSRGRVEVEEVDGIHYDGEKMQTIVTE